MSILILIPARGGSKGIPRKNLRPLNGMPLIYYSVNLALSLKIDADVFVTTDDEEIANIAKKFGAEVLLREPQLSADSTTLDPVIYDGLKKASELKNKNYEIVVTLQPTSPLLSVFSLNTAIEKLFNDSTIDTILSVEDDTHLTWRLENNKYVPNYEKRVNRQQLPKIYKETGGFLITRIQFITKNSRIGENIDLYPLEKPESIDIDDIEDLHLCEFYLKRKKVLIVTNGNDTIGLGHIYNTLSIANELTGEHVIFLLGKESDLGYNKIKEYNYPAHIQKSDQIINDIISFKPDIIINDLLDTSAQYIKSLKEYGYKVVNFEDLGEGAKHADLVINAIYPENEKLQNHYFGHEYFILRDEFYFTPTKVLTKNVNNILITFGGTDANNFTLKVLSSIYDFCIEENIAIHIVTGLGYEKSDSIKSFKQANIHANISNISDYMYNADIIFTSAGRTTFEIASIGVPSIVMAQNERETTHLFASEKYGFKYLGLGAKLSNHQLLQTFSSLVKDFQLRKDMHNRMIICDIKNSKNRSINLIKSLINEM